MVRPFTLAMGVALVALGAAASAGLQSAGGHSPSPKVATAALVVESPAPQWSAAMAYDAARRVVVLFTSDDRGQTWTWDGKGWSQQHSQHTPGPRHGAEIAYDAARERTVLFGGAAPGRPGTSGAPLADTWTWDGTDWRQEFPSATPAPRYRGLMSYDPDRGAVVLFGGGGRPNEFFFDTWAWDGTTWALLTSTPPSDFWGTAPAMAYDPARHAEMVFALPGGANDQSMWFFSGHAWKREQLPPGELPLDGEGIAYDAAVKRVVEFGGNDAAPSSGRSVRSDLWAWDGRSWSSVRAIRTPPPRAYMSMVYDGARQELLVFGGLDGADRSLGDTWTWDGSTWSQKAAPPADLPGTK